MVKTTEQSVDERIGANIRAARTEAGLSQSELAKAATETSGLEWNERLIARMESGDRPLRYSESAAIAQALGVPIGAFLHGTAPLMAQSAEVSRVGRAMKALTHASHVLTEAVNGMHIAQGEYRLAAIAAHAQLRQTWSDTELDAVRAFVDLTWRDVAAVAESCKEYGRQLPGSKSDA